MYIREDLSQKYTPLCSKISLTSCSRPHPRITSFYRRYIPEWFEANAVAYALVVLGSRLARSLVGTPSQPHAPSSSFCVSRIVCTVFFCFFFVCSSPLFARRTPDSVSSLCGGVCGHYDPRRHSHRHLHFALGRGQDCV